MAPARKPESQGSIIVPIGIAAALLAMLALMIVID